ncbi:hypothetical protein IFO70_35525 [Phormidium tenue FACHB-886]|nr:hypothetical protein [Phormidium tenue FACHB-886]
MRIRFSQNTPRVIKRIFAAIFVGLLSGTGCSLQQTQAADTSEQPIQFVGWVEEARISRIESTVKAKLDTGTTTPSIFLAAIGLTIFFPKLTTSAAPLLPNQTFRS